MSTENEPTISVQSGFSEAVATLRLERSLADLAQKIFDCCQAAISDSCSQVGGQSSQVFRLQLCFASLHRCHGIHVSVNVQPIGSLNCSVSWAEVCKTSGAAPGLLWPARSICKLEGCGCLVESAVAIRFSSR